MASGRVLFSVIAIGVGVSSMPSYQTTKGPQGRSLQEVIKDEQAKEKSSQSQSKTQEGMTRWLSKAIELEHTMLVNIATITFAERTNIMQG